MADVEILLKLTSFLHKPRSRYEIQNEIGQKTRSVQKYINETSDEGKFRILNVEFPFKVRKVKNRNKREVSDSSSNEMMEDDNVRLRSTVNPIILPLNTTEVNALTNLIIDLTKNTDYQQIYRKIAEKIYPQLSEYTKSRIGGNKHGLPERGIVTFDKEEGLYGDNIPQDFIYAIKSGEKVKIEIIGGNPIVGTVRNGNTGWYIKNSDGKIYQYSELKNKILSVNKEY